MTPDDFLAWITDPAKAVCAKYDLPYECVVCQGAIESSWGAAIIGQYNLFGRKAVEGDVFVTLPTEEEQNGVMVTVQADFKLYNSLEDAIDDWCQLMGWKDPKDPNIDYKQYADQYHADHAIESFVRGIASIYATRDNYGDEIMETIRACFPGVV